MNVEDTGRFKACVEFEPTKYGQGQHKLIVKDTLTGDCMETYLWEGADKEVEANVLARNLLRQQAKMMSESDKGWRFNVESEDSDVSTS